MWRALRIAILLLVLLVVAAQAWFDSRAQEAQNRIVIAHELLHTFGATDKYDLATGVPRCPEGFAEPQLALPAAAGGDHGRTNAA